MSIKQAECTIQRFMLYLLPLFNLVQMRDSRRAHSFVNDFSGVLISGENFTLQAKVTSLLHMYNACHSSLKEVVFVRLVELCSTEGCFEIISERAQ